MLVLSRNTLESVELATANGTIKVMIIAVRGHKVRLGIEAPKDVNITRTELLARRQQQDQINAAKPSLEGRRENDAPSMA